MSLFDRNYILCFKLFLIEFVKYLAIMIKSFKNNCFAAKTQHIVVVKHFDIQMFMKKYEY